LVAGGNKIATRLAWLIGAAAIGVRLIAITQPFIDNWSWRESDVAAIARNFLENGFHFAHPQIDWAGDAAGYVGTEFPLLPFAAALAGKILGVHEWIGRFETVLFFAASLPIFYLLVRRLFHETVASWALVFYSFAPLSIAASRAFMPDFPSLSLSLVGLYFFLRWCEEASESGWIIASIALSFAILIKGTSAIIGLPILYLSWQRFGISLVRQTRLWILAAITLLPAAIWYWHAHQIAARFYPHHFFGAGGFAIMNSAWYAGIFWRIFTTILTPIVSLLAVVGVFILPRRKYGRVLHWWLAATILFIFFVGYGNRHPWYQLPLIPIAAVFAGITCYHVSKQIQTRLVRHILLSLVILIFAGLSWSYTPAYYTPASVDLYELGLRVKETTPADARIVAADGGDPTIFYYAHRKGWHFLEKNGIWNNLPLNSAEAIANLEDLRDRGATFLVFPFRTRWWLDYYADFAAYLKMNAEPIDVRPRFAIYRLTRSRKTNETGH
jgi:4-amino-4-deoxy-L-arabinose transferase-like glycosyltransferase